MKMMKAGTFLVASAAALLSATLSLFPGQAKAQFANIPVTNDYVIYPQGLCWMIDNVTPYNLFVPFNTPEEFSSFAQNAPADVSAAQCCDTADVTICSDTYTLPVTRTGNTQTLGYQTKIEAGQCYRMNCTNILSGSTQTVTGTGGAGAVVYARSPSTQGTWVVQYDIDTSYLPFYNIDYSCGGHDWSLASTLPADICNPTLPSSAFSVLSTYNCFPDETHPSAVGSGYHFFGSDLCRTYAPLAGPFSSSGSFSQGWGRNVISCGQPSAC